MKVLVKGLAFDKISKDDAANRVLELAKGKTGAYIVTPNTEILARTGDRDFLAVLQGADLVCCDGIGVSLMSFFKGHPLGRVTGMELAQKVLELAAMSDIPVFLYGAKPGVAEKAMENLLTKYRSLNIKGVCHGYVEEDLALSFIRQSGARIVLVCTSSPKQEYFVKKACDGGVSAVFLALGGVLDVLSGDKRQAPKIFCQLGLEWAYRFAKEPFRIKRFVKTVIKGHTQAKIYK